MYMSYKEINYSGRFYEFSSYENAVVKDNNNNTKPNTCIFEGTKPLAKGLNFRLIG